VILHFRTLVDFDIVATIQATSPLVSSTDLDLAMEQFLREGKRLSLHWRSSETLSSGPSTADH